VGNRWWHNVEELEAASEVVVEQLDINTVLQEVAAR
jgi:hypothetical protein